jgi:thiamine biosynthesis lipoprotein
VRKNPVAATKITPKLKQTVVVLFFTGLCAAAPPPGAVPELLRLEKSAEAMGSTYSVVVYGTDRVRMEAAAEAAFSEARRLDDLLSNYKPSSEWSRVNREAAAGPVEVSPELFRLLEACLAYSRASEGAFDISVGALMQVWGFYKGSGRLPHRAEVAAALKNTGYRHVVLNAARRTVRLARPGVALDPGGIGKGYAVDRMVEVLKQYGITTALVAGSASSIYGLGNPPGEPRGWRSTIRDPRDARRTVAEVFLKNESMSTSGSYEKFFRAEGRVWAHIMDPRTGYPAPGMLSASVVAPRTLDSEAWAKPYFILGRSWAARHKPQAFRVFLCEDRTDKACAWLP